MRIMMASLLVTVAWIWPMLNFVSRHPTVHMMILGFFSLALLSSIYSAPQAWYISTIFPTKVRGAGLAISYNIGVLSFGAFAPAIFASLIAVTHNNRSPAIYIAGAGVVSFVSLILLGQVTKQLANSECAPDSLCQRA
jgi:MHS family proline/betaine transporter-like MFS transporter